ncbi:DUF6174 domain-containing protein [Thalassotalea sp. PS06]|uniref:DUF6174 domain-containing protein n=1 Tax=Thalassotalea sp. PS06 TaxID=2594005 RepID=UPI0011649106|nr:DUF6174 domain-containing protein [Thalassotalea sp. PS06]QDP02646.1 hypothetical protein FNC98_15605 [Thalassotalea sp. PS06]
MKRALLFSAVIFLSACGGDSKDEESEINLQKLISENQQLWQSQELMDYQFTMQVRFTDCPVTDEIPAITYRVEDNEIVDAFMTETGVDIDFEDALTISDWFFAFYAILLDDEITLTASSNDDSPPVFDSTLGYPVNFAIDYSSEQCDSYEYRIFDFN